MENFGTYYEYSRNRMGNFAVYSLQKNKILMKKKKGSKKISPSTYMKALRKSFS